MLPPSLPYNIIVYFLPSLQSHLPPPPFTVPQSTTQTYSKHRLSLHKKNIFFRYTLQNFTPNFWCKFPLQTLPPPNRWLNQHFLMLPRAILFKNFWISHQSIPQFFFTNSTTPYLPKTIWFSLGNTKIMTKMWYFVVISLKANLFFFRENVTIFLNHIILVPPTQKFVVFPFSKIMLEICYETRFWKLPTNLSNDFEWIVFQIPNFLVINNSLIHTFAIFSSTILLYLVSLFLLKNFIFFQNLWFPPNKR